MCFSRAHWIGKNCAQMALKEFLLIIPLEIRPLLRVRSSRNIEIWANNFIFPSFQSSSLNDGRGRDDHKNVSSSDRPTHHRWRRSCCFKRSEPADIKTSCHSSMSHPLYQSGLEKVPFYSPFASEIIIWRVTFHTHSPFGEKRIYSQIQIFGVFFLHIFSSFHILIHSILLFSLFNWPHLKRLIHTNYSSFSLGYDRRNKQSEWRVKYENGELNSWSARHLAHCF